MIRRVLKIFGLTLLLLVLVLVGGASWVLGTESGFRQALALAKNVAPGSLEWSEAGGKLVGPLRIRDLRYSEADGIDAQVGALDFDWRPGALFGRELIVERLHVADVEVHLAEGAEPREAPSSGGELPDVSLPVSIDLDDVAIENVALYPAGQDTPIEIDSVALTARAERSDVHVANLDVTAPQGELHLEGDVTIRDDYPMNLTAGWRADIGRSSPLRGEGTFEGSLAELQIEHRIKGFAEADIAATVSDVTTSVAWDASIEAGLPEAEALSPLLTGTPRITVRTSGTPDDYQARAVVRAETTETGPVAVDADVGGSTERLDIRTLVARLPESGGELSATGQVTFGTLQGDLRGEWKALSWPVEGEPRFSSSTGNFDVAGTLDDFTANVVTVVDGEAIPEGRWTVLAEGSTTALDNFDVRGETLEGTVTAGGTASWEGRPSWDVELGTEGINPGVQWSEFPGSIDLNVTSRGRIGEDGPRLSADIDTLSGRLREQALAGGGRVRMAGETLNIDDLVVGLGPSRLNASGQVDDRIAVEFEIDSPDLGTLMPALAGAIAVSGSVSGTRDAPTLDTRGRADGVAYAENTVGELEFSVDAGLGADDVSTVSVNASDITAGGQQIGSVELTGRGTPTDHTLAFTAATDQGDIATRLDGGYRGDTWDGTLSSLRLEDTAAGSWRLRDPVAVTANPAQAEASELCLDNGDDLGSLCVTGVWRAEGESRALVGLDGVSPGLAAEYLPPGLVLETELNGTANAVLGADGVLSAEVELGLEPGKVTVDTDASPVEIGLERTTVSASLRGDDATVDLAAAVTDVGTLSVRGSVADLPGEGRLAGQVDADLADLTLISAFAPQVQQVSGSLVSNLALGGTLAAPRVEGELALRDFGAEIPETAMLIEDTRLAVTGSPDGSLRISGESRSGEGQLTIEGSFDPGSRALDLDVIGDGYEVANTSLMQAVVSPELSIAMSDTDMRVDGTVTIPSAYVNANGGNEGISTVSASSDVVYVTEEGEQAATPPSQLTLDVQIVLGDSIEVEAGDFRGRLEGDLRVQQTPETAPRGTGTIDVVNGDYVIYGQELNMERGRILFSGGPVDNPSLDMEVAREVPEYDVVAGAKIEGTAQAPRLELYSEPPMPDASILSFILIGQPPGTTGGSYTLGKYLTPDLYVSYGIGLFDAINTFNMRYRLTDKLAVEAASGSGSSADLIYTIEK